MHTAIIACFVQDSIQLSLSLFATLFDDSK
jgi:hypothetical protein